MPPVEEKDIAALEKLMDAKLSMLKEQIRDSALTLEKWTNTLSHLVKDTTATTATALEKSTSASLSMLEKRLESMNEFRASLSDQTRNYYTKSEHDSYQKLVETDLRFLRESRAELQGKASQSSMNVTFGLAAIGALTGMVAVILNVIRMK